MPIAFGTEEIETTVIVDILRRAGADVLMASIEQELQVEASRRVKFMADDKIESCDGKDFDLIALPVCLQTSIGGLCGFAREGFSKEAWVSFNREVCRARHGYETVNC